MATSLIWAVGDGASTVYAFLASIAITAGVGGVGWLLGRGAGQTIARRDALFIVGIAWLLLGVFGGLPYLFDGAFTSPADAYFETVSGFTTTGSTVLTNIEGLSDALHWWRGMTHWLGGMGIIVLFVAIFPHLGVGAKMLFKSEVPGPITEGLKPKIRETSAALWKIYFALTMVLAIVLYIIGPSAEDCVRRGLSPNAEMDWHNAFVHAFATLATGGFSTLNNSVAGFQSVSIDLVITGFMLIAGVNFSLYYAALRKGSLTPFKDTELKVYLSIIAVATVVVALDVYLTTPAAKHESLAECFRYAVFQVVGVITTTGFGTDDFNIYPSLSKILLVCLMFVGGMAGSTAGGMKVLRFVVIFRVIWQQIRHVLHPAMVQVVKVNNRRISNTVALGAISFFALGIFVFVGASLYMASLGLDMATSMTSVAATLFNIGPGLSQVGPIESFAFLPASAKLVLSFCMILGRLEFYAIIVLFVPEFWRN